MYKLSIYKLSCVCVCAFIYSLCPMIAIPIHNFTRWHPHTHTLRVCAPIRYKAHTFTDAIAIVIGQCFALCVSFKLLTTRKGKITCNWKRHQYVSAIACITPVIDNTRRIEWFEALVRAHKSVQTMQWVCFVAIWMWMHAFAHTLFCRNWIILWCATWRNAHVVMWVSCDL